MASNASWDDILGQHMPHTPDIPDQVNEDDLGYCASRPVAKVYHALGIKRPGRDDEFLCYQYAAVHLGKASNTTISFLFAGHELWKLTVTGRNLLKLAYFIKEAKIDWIRAADRDWDQDDGKPFISKIELVDVTPSPEG